MSSVGVVQDLKTKLISSLFKMKGGFWNSDGFRDSAKHSFVHETIRDLKLDFFAIIEMARENSQYLF